MSDANAVVDRRPVFRSPFSLLILLAHDRGELSRRILGEPLEVGIVGLRGVAESESAEISRPSGHSEYA